MDGLKKEDKKPKKEEEAGRELLQVSLLASAAWLAKDM